MRDSLGSMIADDDSRRPGSQNIVDYKQLWDEQIEQIRDASQKANPLGIPKTLDKYYHKYYFQLDSLVDDMQSRVQGVIRQHEMNFLESYRNHMRHIQRDLDKYKKALNEKEFMNRRDEKIVKLQTNVEWFKKEALALSKANLKLKEENFLLKQRNMLVEAEKVIAEQTAQKVKDRTNQLREALKRTHTNCDYLLDQIKTVATES